MRLRIRGKRAAALAALLAVALAAPITANGTATASAPPPVSTDEDIRQYEIDIHADKVTRTALARTGVTIDDSDGDRKSVV